MAAVKLRKHGQPLKLQFFLWVVELLASLRLAVVVLAACAAVLAWATFLESRYGAEPVRFGIYGAWWFTALNVLLAVNVIAAAVIRYPWRRYQTGFVIIHLGVVVLLLGCLVTRWRGLDAQLSVFEGRANGRAFENTQHLQLTIHPRKRGTFGKVETVAIPFVGGPFNWDDYKLLSWFPWSWARRDRGVVHDRDGIQLEVLDYYSDSVQEPIPQITLRIDSKPGTKAKKGFLPADRGRVVKLAVRENHHPHLAHSQLAMGSREQLPHGERVAFWLAGAKAETNAFLNSRPNGPLGAKGQIVLVVEGRTTYLDVDSLEAGTRKPLKDSNLEVEFVRFNPKLLGVELKIHGPEGKPRRMLLFADFPEFNEHDSRHGVFGSYWFDTTNREATASLPDQTLRRARGPRIDIIQGSDLKLYYRAWNAPRVEEVAAMPNNGTRITAFQSTATPVVMRLEEFYPSEIPSTRTTPVPFNPKKNDALKERQAHLRLTVDDVTEEFWLAGMTASPLDQGPRESQRHGVASETRRVVATMPRDQVELGFEVFLHKFNRKLDPGTSQPSHYSSLVDFIEPAKAETAASAEEEEASTDARILQKDVLITLNAPVDFVDPRGGRSYRLFQESFRGPWKPGDPLFDELVGGNNPRDSLFLSWLTVNYDPGRGLKYAGCLLITLGIGIAFYMKAYFFKKRPTIIKSA